SRVLKHERRRTAAEIAEHERCSSACCRIQCQYDIVQEHESFLEERNVKKDCRDRKLNHHAREDGPQSDTLSFFAQHPSDRKKYANPQHTLNPHGPSFRMGLDSTPAFIPCCALSGLHSRPLIIKKDRSFRSGKPIISTSNPK